jgi:hypothetical protein
MLLMLMTGLVLTAYFVATIVARGRRAAYERRRLEELSETNEYPFEGYGRYDQ